MFRFDHDRPQKVVATASIPIYPDHRTTPMIWTPGLVEFQARRVFILCTVNQRGRQSMRFYPLQKKAGKAPPAFVVVKHDSPYVENPTTHVVFDHSNFKIIRPLKAVYYKARWAMERGELDWLPGNLLTLIKHCYFKDLIDDEFIGEVEKEFGRLENILARANGSDFQGEVDVCIRKAYILCEKIFQKITKEVKNYV